MRQQLNLLVLKERVRQESLSFANFILASKPAYKYAFGALFAGFLLGLLNPTYELLVLTINDVFNFHIWRIATCILIEPNVLLFGWSLLAVHQFSTYIAPVWGLPEIAKCVAIVQLLTTLLIAVLGLILFACFQALDLFYYVPICGFPVASISALVALKQYLPDTVVLTTPYGRLKNGHLPLTALFCTTIFWLIGLVRPTVPLQVMFGLQISWTYLRFFQSLPGSEHIGDDNEHFTWSSLFPRRVQPLATVIAKAVFPVLVALRLCKKLKDVELNAFETIQSSLPESRDAERKRQKALRVLNERLTLATSPSKSNKQTHQPSLDSPPIQGNEEEVEMDDLLDVNVVSPAKHNEQNTNQQA